MIYPRPKGIDNSIDNSINNYRGPVPEPVRNAASAWLNCRISGAWRPFATAKAKFIRITQTGKAPGTFWSIHELDILSEGKGQISAGKAEAKKPSFE